MGGLRTRHLGAMGPRVPSLSGPLAGGLGGGGGWRAAPKWEATESLSFWGLLSAIPIWRAIPQERGWGSGSPSRGEKFPHKPSFPLY